MQSIEDAFPGFSLLNNSWGGAMRADEAARALDKKLRPYSWYLSVGVGESNGRAALYLYVKFQRHKELREMASGWMGFQVIIRPVGSISSATSQAVEDVVGFANG
jgi:hypothetical protein